MRRYLLTSIAIVLPVLSAGCASVGNKMAAPELSPIADPAIIASPATVSMPGAPIGPRGMAPASANSLWRAGAKGFFDDQRASLVGDILTVNISITDNAQVRNTTTTSRQGQEDANLSAFFGLQNPIDRALPGTGSLNPALGLSSTSTTNGTGTVNRAETVNLTVAAVITGVLPNGNLVIAGRQEVKVNAEVRELLVSGIIRPEDISAQNTIRHTQIAEARISYGGRGDLSDVQRPRYGQRLIDGVMPF